MLGDLPAARHGRLAARRAWGGLAAVLTGPDCAPAWRSPGWRRAAAGGLGGAVLLAYAATLVCLPHGRFYLLSQSVTTFAQHGGWPIKYSWPAPLQLVLLVLVGVLGPLLLAARYPLLGWRIGWLALLFLPLAGIYWRGGMPWDPVQPLVVLVLFCAAALRQTRSVGWWMWALTLIPWWWWLREAGRGSSFGTAGTIGLTAAAVAVDAIGARGRAQRALAGQAELTELERGRRAVLQERARIARELHDVVAHHTSLIAVRAETAPYRLSGLPEPVAAEFRALSEAAREALADMRRLLKVLRDDQPAARAPQPRLPDLPGLIDSARQAGVAVELSMQSRLDRLPSAVEVCAYRIVQEALSNARRHAPGTAVAVELTQKAGTLAVQVANGGARPQSLNGHQLTNGHQPGHGLTGMRERVALLGGTLSAGPSSDGGYLVAAVLPVGEPA